MRYWLLLLLTAWCPGVAMAQASTPPRVPGTTVSGVVHDSLARRPLAGATVQIIAADGQARFSSVSISDSLGRFSISDVPNGRFRIGFFHPLLDSLGLEPPMREVSVDGRRPMRADLATPSATRLRAAYCATRADSVSNSRGVVVGVIRDAQTGAPMSGATVTAEWVEFSIILDGLDRRTVRQIATTAEGGRFTMCGVPSQWTLALNASRGVDSTDVIDLQIPADGFSHRELYIGQARVLADSQARNADTLSLRPTVMRTGDGRLSGTVRRALEDTPVSGAQVGILDGPQTRTNDRGEWTLSGAPAGTRVLEVRAVGYYPERLGVDVVTGAPLIRTSLSTMQAVLDTVRVTASSRATRNMIGFEDRRRSGVGYYIGAEEIAGRVSVFTSDLLRMTPGMYVGRSPNPAEGNLVLMRGIATERCRPTLYIDGNYMMDLGGTIDDWVSPDEIAGIEIYAAGMSPMQFQKGGPSLCGSIVIWTKPRAMGKKWTTGRLVAVISTVSLGFLLSALLSR